MSINEIKQLVKTSSTGILAAVAAFALSGPIHADGGIREFQTSRKLYAPGPLISQTFVAKKTPTGSGFANRIGSLDVDNERCVCTNLANVSVICEDCDNESRVDYCYTHDRACQDAAQKGGIREHGSFFCTTTTIPE